jgi:hypothetical protein
MRFMREDKKSRANQGRSVDEAAKRVGVSRSSTYREDDLTRLIRIIARQAAREAFSVFRDAFDADAIKPPAPA